MHPLPPCRRLESTTSCPPRVVTAFPPFLPPTAQVGIQEKQTFVQAFGKPTSLYEPRMWLPGLIQLLLLATGLAVLFHHQTPAVPPAHHHRRQQFGDSSEADGAEDAALVAAQMSETDELHFERDARHSA